MIATPTYDGRLDIETYHSVLNLLRETQNQGISTSVRTKVGMLVDRARNIFASQTLNDPTFSHLLFVDADMGFRAEAAFRMLTLDKPLVGALYPTRTSILRFIGAERILQAPEAGVARVAQVGAGLMLIRRDVLEKMRDAYPDIYLPKGEARYAMDGLDGPVLQAFAPMITRRGHVVGEDVSFCRRWTKIGGEIWALTDEEIAHTGRHVVRARYSDHVETPDVVPGKPL